MADITRNITFRAQDSELRRAGQELRKLNETMTQLGNTARVLTSEMGRVAAVAGGNKFAEMSRRARGYAQELEHISKSANNAATSTAKIPRQLNAFEKAAKAIHGGSVAIEHLEANIYSASRGFALFSQMVARRPVQALRLFTSASFQATTGMTRMAFAAKSLGEAFAFVAASRFGVIAIMFGAIAGLSAAARGTVRSFAELEEQTMKVMSAITVAEGAAISYNKVWYSIAENAIRYGKAFEDVGKVQWELKSAGLSTSEAMAGVAANMMLMYTEIENIGQATRMTAGIFMTFRDELMGSRDAAEAFEYMGDVLAYTMNRSMVDADTLTQSFKFSLASAEATGLGFEELSAVIATLNNHMIMSGRAGRSVNRMLSQLNVFLPEVADKYNLVYDAAKPLGPQLFSILSQLNKGIGEGALSMDEFTRWMKGLGLRGGPALIALVRNFDELKDILDDINAGDVESALAKIAATRMDTLNAQWGRFKETVKAVSAELSRPFLGDAKVGFRGLADAGEWWIKTQEKISQLEKERQGQDWWKWVERYELSTGKIGKNLVGSAELIANIYGVLKGGMDIKSAMKQREKAGGAEYIESLNEAELLLGGLHDKYKEISESIRSILSAQEQYNLAVAEGKLTVDITNNAIKGLETQSKSLWKSLTKIADEEEWNKTWEAILKTEKAINGMETSLKKATEFPMDKMVNFLRETDMLTDAEYMAYLTKSLKKEMDEYNKAVKGGLMTQVKEGGDVLNVYTKLTREMEKQKKAQDELNRSVARMKADFTIKGGMEDERSLRRRIDYLNAMKYLGDPSQVQAFNKQITDLYDKLGKITGEDYFSKNVLAVTQNEEAMRGLANSAKAAANDMKEMGLGIDSVLGGKGPISEALKSIKEMSTPIDTMNEKITTSLEPGFGLIYDHTNNTHKMFGEINKEIDTMIKKLERASNINLSGGTGGGAGISVSEELMSGE